MLLPIYIIVAIINIVAKHKNYNINIPRNPDFDVRVRRDLANESDHYVPTVMEHNGIRNDGTNDTPIDVNGERDEKTIGKDVLDSDTNIDEVETVREKRNAAGYNTYFAHPGLPQNNGQNSNNSYNLSYGVYSPLYYNRNNYTGASYGNYGNQAYDMDYNKSQMPVNDSYNIFYNGYNISANHKFNNGYNGQNNTAGYGNYGNQGQNMDYYNQLQLPVNNTYNKIFPLHNGYNGQNNTAGYGNYGNQGQNMNYYNQLQLPVNNPYNNIFYNGYNISANQRFHNGYNGQNNTGYNNSHNGTNIQYNRYNSPYTTMNSPYNYIFNKNGTWSLSFGNNGYYNPFPNGGNNGSNVSQNHYSYESVHNNSYENGHNGSNNGSYAPYGFNITTTTPRIVQSYIFSMGCPAFFKRVGIYCARTDNA